MERSAALTSQVGRPADLTLRAATAGDSARLREWRNDPVAVAFSVTRRRVADAEHDRWLRKRLDDPDTSLWIAEDRGTAVGQVRVDRIGDVGTVSIGVAPDHRGRRLATAILLEMVDEIERAGSVSELRATVHPDNTPSFRAFEKVGFIPTGERDRGFLILRLRIHGTEGDIEA
jgi:RimJ/RimL family protein N-acetyltransferase